MDNIENNNHCNTKNDVEEEEGRRIANHRRPCWYEMELPLEIAAETFRLEKAVCSHGLFMMAPNYWDPLSNTLTRPLRLSLAVDDRSSSSPSSSSSSSSDSVIVSISQPSERPGSLSVRVYGIHSISPQQEHALLAQVSRMLRLSETEEKAVREFRSMSYCGNGDQNRSFSGRVFRSPTLFEDMVKCILLCNCQWSRTLSMAQALCELQLELQKGSSLSTVTVSGNPKVVETKEFIPKTPATKESKRKKSASGFSTKIEKKPEFEVTENFQEDHANACQDCKSCQKPEYFAYRGTGNFPSPEELANLDESFLAKRCNLGYRASRILKLSQAIVDGRIQLTQLEELSKDASLLNYNMLTEHLKEIEGFGPFTCANVLMCLGYYNVIPADSETIRHLKQVHSRKSTSQTIQRDVEQIYGKYEPYQFLAYWSELWEFYETRFGKMNEMACSDYNLITASNMRSKGKGRKNRKQTS